MKNHYKNNWGIIITICCWVAIFIFNLSPLSKNVNHRWIKFNGVDFDQYYAGSVVVSDNLWNIMYPTNLKETDRLASSELPLEMESAIIKKGGKTRTKFIYPPTSAILYYPLSLFSFYSGMTIFMVFLCVCYILFLHILQKEIELITNNKFIINLTILISGIGLPVGSSFTSCNISPLIPLCGIIALRGISNKNNRFFTSIAFVLGALTKGFSIVWVPFLIIFKQYKTILFCAIISLVLIYISYLKGATLDIYIHYIKEILPASKTLYRIGDANLTLSSFICYINNSESLTPLTKSILSTIKIFIYFITYFLLYRYCFKIKSKNKNIIGVVFFIVTVTFMLFSSHCLPSYIIYLLPFIPRIYCTIKEINSNKTLKKSLYILFTIGFLISYFPICNVIKHLLAIDILGYGRMFGYIIMLSISIFLLLYKSTKTTNFIREN